ncbi:hypothetical protein [Sulfurisphaera javensis]
MKKNDITLYISTFPLETEDDFLEKLKETFDVEEACDGKNMAECFAIIYGGIVISKNSIFKRIELEGYFKESDKGIEFEINRFLENPYNCYTFDNGTICFIKNKEKDSRFVDNVGLRFIIK